jgi:hypothetical protein
MRVTRNFIERMYAVSQRPIAREEGKSWIHYEGRRFASLSFNDADHDRYRECIDKLLDAVGARPEDRTISPDAVESMLHRALIRSLCPPPADRERTRVRFERRLRRELRDLRSKITTPLREWEVVVQVHGLGPHGLPFRFGGVDLEPGRVELGERLARRIVAFEPKRRTAKETIAAEERGRTKSRSELSEAFSTHAAALVRVRAVDGRAAKRIGMARIRRTIDVLNFFFPFFDSFGRTRRAYVAPSGPNTSYVWGAFSVEGEELRWSGLWPARELRAAGFALDSERATECGASRADALLASADPTDFEQRIVNAIAWAGRATVEGRRDQAFLSYAIALESLLTKPGARIGVSDRLRLRVAHLIGRTRKARLRILGLMEKIYDLRSALVHAGDSGALTKSDLETIKIIVERALAVVLRDQRFTSMRGSREFDEWCESQLLGSDPLEEGGA